MHELKFEHIELYVAKDVQIDCKNRMCVLDCGPCPCRACWPVLAVPCVLAGAGRAVRTGRVVRAGCACAVRAGRAVQAGRTHAVRAGRCRPRRASWPCRAAVRGKGGMNGNGGEELAYLLSPLGEKLWEATATTCRCVGVGTGSVPSILQLRGRRRGAKDVVDSGA